MDVEKIENGIAGVYRITCKQNNKNYIGVSKNIRKRWNAHINLLKNNRHHSTKLQEDFNKYGEDFFEFRVVEVADHGETKKLEDKYIEEYKSDIKGYNCESHLDNIKTRDKIYCESILEYIKDSYKSDGNVYCYDVFNIAKYLNITATEFLKFLGINSLHEFSVFKYLDDTKIIGLNWSNQNIFVQVYDKNLYNNKGDFVEVDILVY